MKGSYKKGVQRELRFECNILKKVADSHREGGVFNKKDTHDAFVGM